jgi:UDP-glucose:(heptosyl)LPS alpha-1,3-glucosyltransferase
MASDIFVFPTYYEAFSLATLEAAAAGLPILMTRVNGSDEILIENKNGYLIERNATNIAEKIESIIYDEKKMREMSKKSRQIAEQYSWDKISKLTYEKYKEILENSKEIISK